MFYNLLDAGTDGTTNNIGTMIAFGVMVVLIVGLLIWQTVTGKKKQKEAQNMIDSIKVGDRVMTIGYICGFVVEINNAENTIVIETGSEGKKGYLKIDKGGVYRTAPNQGSEVPAPKKEEVTEEVKEENK